jgi:hypothetical protein
MGKQNAAPNPDAPLTARALERAIRASLPSGAPGIGTKTILAELHAGRLRGARIGRWWRTSWRAYLAWLDAQRVVPTPESETPTSDADRWAREKVDREERRSAGGAGVRPETAP